MTTLLEPFELRSRGFEVLSQSLGWVNAVRFMQQFEPSRRDYTQERDAILPELGAEEIARQVRAISKGQS
jgi:hypothetical protein